MQIRLKSIEVKLVNFLNNTLNKSYSSMSAATFEDAESLLTQRKLSTIEGDKPLRNLFMKSGVKQKEWRYVIEKSTGDKNSDNFSKVLQLIGTKENFTNLINQRGREEWLAKSGYGKDVLDRLLKENSVKFNTKLSPTDITQKLLRDWPLTNILMSSSLHSPFELINKMYRREFLAYKMKNLPQGYLKLDKNNNSYSHEHLFAYNKLKKELSIKGVNWGDATSGYLTLIDEGKLMMKLFGNSISQMVIYFENKKPITKTVAQRHWCIGNVRQAILDAANNLDIDECDIISCSLKKMIDEGGLSKRIPNWFSENNTSYVKFLIEQFPQYNWVPWQSHDVENGYWIDGDRINKDNVKNAINWLVNKVYHVNIDNLQNSKKIEYLSNLNNKSAIKNNLGGMLSVTQTGMIELVKIVYHDLEIEKKEHTKTNRQAKLFLESLGYYPNSEVTIKTNSKILYDDLRVSTKELDFVLEIQGGQHANKFHYFHQIAVSSGRSKNLDCSLKTSLDNDAEKFSYHCKQERPVYYVKDTDLENMEQFISVIETQGFNLKTKERRPIDLEQTLKYLENEELVAKGFGKQVKKLLKDN